ncbi:MAG: hypothetical protein ACSHX8_15970 [Opitutaceae bacterium]
MKNLKYLGIVVLCGTASLQTAVQLQAAEDAYIEPDFSKAEPVRMEILQDGGQRRLGARFVRPSSEGVEIEMLDGDGAIIVGWDHMEQFTINIPMTEELEIALSHQDPNKRVELLKPKIWPLLPLASIRSESTNVHILLNAYLKAVIKSEEWTNGFDMSQYMALNRSPAETVQYLYTIAENLFLIGEHAKALKLIDQLTSARPAEEFLSLGQGVAKRMLDLRLFAPALKLYRTISEASSGLEKKKALFTCAYISLELGTTEEAQDALEEAKAIPEADPATIGMEYLCAGVMAFLGGDTTTALNNLGHSMATLPTSSAMQQPGFYYIYLSYWNTEQPEIAKNILDEMDLLFPDGAYTALLVGESKATESTIN